MIELVDKLVDKIERFLITAKVELDQKELDEVRDVLDSVLGKYEEQVYGTK